MKRFTLTDTNCMKGIGILCMYYHHFYLSTDRFKEYDVSFYPLSTARGVKIAVFLKICVAIFLFLSGYGMYVSQKKSDFRSLIAASVKRYIKLTASFLFIFWIVQIVFFYTGRFFKIYGTGLESIGYVLIDSIGLAHLFHTPTYLGTWWYMSLISLIIWIFPLLYKSTEKKAWLAVLFWGVLSYSSLAENYELFRWMPSFLAGMLFARFELFENISSLFEKQKQPAKNLLYAAMSVLLLSMYYFRRISWIPIGLRDALIVSYLAVYVFMVMDRLVYLRAFLQVLGVHSMTMFLTHTLVRQTFFKDFSYSFGWAYLNVAVVLALTWLSSCLIDTMASKSGYNRIYQKLAAKAAGWIERG